MNKLGRVHPLFRIPHNAPSCVNGCCREKRLEYIYIGVYTGYVMIRFYIMDLSTMLPGDSATLPPGEAIANDTPSHA